MGGKHELGGSHRILDDLLEGCQIVDRDYRYVYLNDAVIRHSRMSREQLLGRTMAECYPGIEDTEMFALLSRCMQERVPCSLENRFTFPGGAHGWFDLRFEPVSDGVLILSIDVTERKRAEAALRRTLRALATLSRCNQTLVRATDERRFVEDVCDLVVESGQYRMGWIGLLDGSGRLRPVARAGVSDDEWSRLCDTDWLEALGIRAIESGQPTLAQVEANSLELISSIALPVNEGSQPIGALSIYSDDPEAFDGDARTLIEEVAMDLGYGIEVLRGRAARSRVEKRLEEVQRLEAVGRLAGGIAHDFNNLLSVILSYSSLAIDQLEAEDIRADIREIHKAGVRAAALTRQLLAFSRKQILEPRVTNLNHILSGLEDMLRRLLGEHIRIEIEPAADLGNVRADPGQLEQVVVNLAINARDAMPRGGRLLLETGNVELDPSYTERHVSVSPGPYVQLSVTDTGSGMSEEIRERVFEPFFTTKETGVGTGLGLSSVYGIVKQSGGHISVYSEPEQGTVFKIYLPRVDEPVGERQPSRPTIAAGGGETILLVEDEGAVRNAGARILRAAGYRVLLAADGEQALALCGEHGSSIDLLLTDVVMPKMSGRELAERLAEINPKLKVLFTSGFTDNAIVHHGVLDPGTRFISKPFSITDLTRVVRAVLDD